MHNWQESNIKISEIGNLLLEDYEIEVDSPDGWVPVNDFVDKGLWQEYILKINGEDIVRCNEAHLFETINGWKSAKELSNDSRCLVLNNVGEYIEGCVIKNEEFIPIVDIQVNHPNHRYYTNGISSHNTNVGKSLAMCHMATAHLLAGKNVLYITCEMAEERIAERIDANALDIPLESLKQISKKQYLTAMKGLHDRTSGKLIIKEYPTSSVNVSNFRFLLHELEIKKKFVPDIIYVDYLNICTSSTIKNTGLVNSYTLIKNISEEFRALAVEKNLPIVTATQFTRSGSTNSDADMTDISESFGLAASADLLLALIKTDELTQMNQLMFKQLKNRFADVTKYVKFLVGVDRNKMRLYDLGDNSGVEGEFQQPTPELLNENTNKMAKFGSFKF